MNESCRHNANISRYSLVLPEKRELRISHRLTTREAGEKEQHNSNTEPQVPRGPPKDAAVHFVRCTQHLLLKKMGAFSFTSLLLFVALVFFFFDGRAVVGWDKTGAA
jgi:hypothetical protein